MSHLTQLVVLIPAVLALELPIAAQAVPPAAVRLLDVSGDGVPDKLFLDADGSIRIAVHSGARRFDPVAQDLPKVAAVSDVLAADLDGDDRLDLYFVTRGANLALVGEGYGRFHEATEALGLVDAGPGRTVERRDLDADGAFDLVLHNDGGDVLFWARRGAAFERDGDCPAQAAERPVDPALLPEILVALAEEARHPLSAGGAVEASVGSDEHGRPVVTLRPTRPTAGPGPAGGPVAGTPSGPVPTTGSGSGGPPSGRVSGPIDATVGPGLGVNLNTVFVNDNGNEVDSADVIDGALTGADISTTTGNVGVGTLAPSARLQVMDNDASGGSAGAVVFASNSATTGGLALWARTAGTDATVVADQFGTGPLIKGFRSGSEVFSVGNNGRIVSTVNGSGGGTGSAAIYARNTSSAAGVGVYSQTQGTEPSLVLVQDGAGPILKAIRAGVERFNINNSGRVVVTVNDATPSKVGAAIYTTNTATTGGLGLWAETHGSDATVVVDQVGTGPLIKGFSGGVEKFTVGNSGSTTVDSLGVNGPPFEWPAAISARSLLGGQMWLGNPGSGGSGIAGYMNVYDWSGAKRITVDGGDGKVSADRVATKVLEITGADLIEPFAVDDPRLDAGTVVSIDPSRPGSLTTSSVPYDRCVAGVVSGAGGIDPGIRMGQMFLEDGSALVALIGRVYVKCSTENGPIEPGNLLTTSSLAGHAMRASDPQRCDGTVIGKAMTGLQDGTGLVLVLVNLQ